MGPRRYILSKAETRFFLETKKDEETHRAATHAQKAATPAPQQKANEPVALEMCSGESARGPAFMLVMPWHEQSKWRRNLR